ncbi:MAG TPA: anthranilate phosphoribosyltransferase [Candidatus Competibacteraceae bacterium]|nr:anthranilate phosphoribosyltransferase [Candidatus Competibacteraceae bacterium]
MDMQTAIRTVIEGRHLSMEQMAEVMRTIMSGQASPAQIGGFLVGLHMKGETVEEIAAAAQVMRELAIRVEVRSPHLLDTCGTGGDASGTFNISTASALVAAAAGAKVAKHGNRSVSGKTGSADVLEAAGVRLELNPEQIGACIETVGFGFLFAPLHHGAMKHAIGPRREMGVRTVFNLLGPLTNPAGAPNQVMGVFAVGWVEPLAYVLQRLGSRHVMVVHSEDVLDEISIGAPTHIAELKDGEVRSYSLTPEDFGLQRRSLEAIKAGTIGQSLEMIQDVLAGQPGPASDIVALNAGAGIYTAGLATSLQEGVHKARTILAEGAAARVLEQLISFSRLV